MSMNEYDIVKKSIMQSNNDKSDSIMELIKQNQDFNLLLIQHKVNNHYTTIVMKEKKPYKCTNNQKLIEFFKYNM